MYAETTSLIDKRVFFASESVMHYGAYDFSKNGQKTIVRLDGSEAALGNKVGFSQVIN